MFRVDHETLPAWGSSPSWLLVGARLRLVMRPCVALTTTATPRGRARGPTDSRFPQSFVPEYEAAGKCLDEARQFGNAHNSSRDCLVRYRRNGKVLAVASVFRDADDLKEEVSLEYSQSPEQTRTSVPPVRLRPRRGEKSPSASRLRRGSESSMRWVDISSGCWSSAGQRKELRAVARISTPGQGSPNSSPL